MEKSGERRCASRCAQGLRGSATVAARVLRRPAPCTTVSTGLDAGPEHAARIYARMRVLELYAGIGGCASALGGSHEVAAAVEQSDVALEVYRRNFSHPTWVRNIVGLTERDLAQFSADLWWLSPPCQSFTIRGERRDTEDSRAKSLLHLLSLLRRVRPRHIALENVPGFEGSRAHGALRAVLAEARYRVRERSLCPTELGVPNRRRRFYVVASRDDLRAVAQGSRKPPAPRPLRAYLEARFERDPPASLLVDERVLAKYHHAMQILDPEREDACAGCFTSAYGRSPVRSGAYLRTGAGVRFLSPSEILGLLHFPLGFSLPPDLPDLKAWALVGNSLSVVAVREVLRAIPGFEDAG